MAPSLYKKTVSAVSRSLMTTHSVSGEGSAFEVPSALTTVTDEKSGSLSVAYTRGIDHLAALVDGDCAGFRPLCDILGVDDIGGGAILPHIVHGDGHHHGGKNRHYRNDDKKLHQSEAL